LIYQGRMGRLLLKRDTALLGIEMVNEEEALIKIAKKSGSEVINL